MSSSQYHLNKAIQFIGHKFGRLVIQKILKEKTKDGHLFVECICECGKIHSAQLSMLKAGKVKSCGCLNVEKALLNVKKACAKKGRLPHLGTAKKIFDCTYKDGNVSFEDFLKLSQQNCFYCGAIPNTTVNVYLWGNIKNKTTPERIRDGYFTYNGLDRVDNSLPHNIDNVVTCCVHCNRAKLKRNINDFISWAHQIVKTHPIPNKKFITFNT